MIILELAIIEEASSKCSHAPAVSHAFVPTSFMGVPIETGVLSLAMPQVSKSLSLAVEFDASAYSIRAPILFIMQQCQLYRKFRVDNEQSGSYLIHVSI